MVAEGELCLRSAAPLSSQWRPQPAPGQSLWQHELSTERYAKAAGPGGLRLFLATSHETGGWLAGLPWNFRRSPQALLEVASTRLRGLCPS